MYDASIPGLTRERSRHGVQVLPRSARPRTLGNPVGPFQTQARSIAGGTAGYPHTTAGSRTARQQQAVVAPRLSCPDAERRHKWQDETLSAEGTRRTTRVSLQPTQNEPFAQPRAHRAQCTMVRRSAPTCFRLQRQSRWRQYAAAGHRRAPSSAA